MMAQRPKFTRRRALASFWAWALASPALRAQRSPYEPDRLSPLEGLVNPHDIEAAARRLLPEAIFEHLAAGAGAEHTVRRNREYFNRITFRPRMLVDVSGMDLSLRLFGADLFAPIIAGPTANHGRLHPDGEKETVRGASAAQAALVLSERSSVSVGNSFAEKPQPYWAQVFARADADAVLDRVEAAVAAGASAIFLTIDGPVFPRIDRDRHFQTPKAVNPGLRAPDWGLIGQVKSAVKVPLVIKGILRPADASEAVAQGADGIVVSNHGGRAVDGLPAAVEALPAIAREVNERVPVLVDGGFRRGSDILKGLALGADAVLIGRPVLWALAAYGAPGVQKLLEMLQTELALAMGLAGKANLAAVGSDLVKVHSR